jgi:hypothetical protein
VTGAADGRLADAERIRRLEDRGRDFPFYRGWPVALSGPQWLLVLAGVLGALLVVAFPPAVLNSGLARMVPALLLARAAPAAGVCRSSSSSPPASTRPLQPGSSTVVPVGSTTSAGPAIRWPAVS